MEKKKFNFLIYFLRTFFCFLIWLGFVYLIIFYFPLLPQKDIHFDISGFKVTLEIYHILGILSFFVIHYLIANKLKVYLYTFETDCKKPVILILLNILLSSAIGTFIVKKFIVLILDYFVIPFFFIFVSFINYFIYYLRHGKELTEIHFVDDWTRDVNK